MKDNNSLIGIGTFSMITRLTKRALRLYDDKGLLSPARKEITGYRQYSYKQIYRGMQLKRLADIGFGIQDMKEIMDAMDGFSDGLKLDNILKKRLEEVGVEVARLKKIRGLIQSRNFLEVLDLENEEVIVKEVPRQRIVSRREKGIYQEVIPRLIGELMERVFSPENQQARVKCVGPPMSIYYDDEFKENDADIEVALPISGNITVGPEFEVKMLDEGTVVSYIHKGPYQEVGGAYSAVFEYIDKERFKVAGNCRELYLNDPKETPEAGLLTEVQVPVEG